MQAQTAEYSIDWSKHTWVTPQKLIKEVGDLEVFKGSESYKNYVNFVMRLQMTVESKPISATPENPKFKLFLEFLDRLIKLVDEVPPIQQKMRFGNTAFKDWHSKAMVIGTFN